MIKAFRVIKSRHASHALDGEGTRLYGGRWNSKGTRVVYASQTLSLAVLEILVHLQATKPLATYVYYELSFDEALVQEARRDTLPRNWREIPAPPELQRIGDEWARHSESLVLSVPSAVLQEEWNYLINPAHPDFRQLKVRGPFDLDPDPRVLGPKPQ